MRYDYTNLAKRHPLFGGPGFTPRNALIAAALAALPFIGPMATYNYKGGVNAGTAAGQIPTPGAFSVVDIKLDFAAIKTDRANKSQTALAAADVLELIPVRAGTWVPAAFMQTTTVEGAAATFDLGDGATAAGFISNHDGNAIGWSSNLITTTYSVATAGGKLYTADDTVDVIVDNNNVDVAVLQVFAILVDLRAYR